ncbi:MAG TPA: OmpA family protein [Acetobacteraceae bacterium]|nr:OmpA family protein [Acetobacteraceae bacterium]
MRVLITPIILAPLMLGSLPAFAQGNPSADQIINSLKPSGNLVMGGTRGIRLAPTNDAATPAAATHSQTPTPQAHIASAKPMAVPVAAAQPAPAAGPTVNLTVNFLNGSAELTPEAIRTLDELGRALASKDLAAYRFRIEGHTDTVGAREYNRALSERRAIAVVDYVSKKYGVEPSRLQAVGMGEDGLLVQTPPQTAEPRNRRVQVINLGA